MRYHSYGPPIVMLFGLGMFVYATPSLWRSVRLTASGVEVQGNVSAVREALVRQSKSGMVTRYFSTVQFNTVEGMRFEFESKQPEETRPLVGSKVILLYLPSDPSTFHIGDTSHWRQPLFLLGIGFMALATGVLCLRYGTPV